MTRITPMYPHLLWMQVCTTWAALAKAVAVKAGSAAAAGKAQGSLVRAPPFSEASPLKHHGLQTLYSKQQTRLTCDIVLHSDMRRIALKCRGSASGSSNIHMDTLQAGLMRRGN